MEEPFLNEGRIIKLIGGLYTVVGTDRSRHELKPLGIFRHRNISPKVGDFCRYDESSITEIFPRHNDLIRPAIANIDQAILVTSTKRPDFSRILLDKFLALIIYSHIEPLIVLTKVDLLTENERKELVEIISYYQRYFRVFYFSAKTKEGLNELLEALHGKVNVLTGQSGAGKSSLINTIDPTLNLETDEISLALGRGKHTTRHVELLELAGGWIADTPGFSKLEFDDMDLPGLKDSFPDFFEVSGKCKFSGCLHLDEPLCEVKRLLSENKIPRERYDDYRRFVEEIQHKKPKY